jgi:Tol biopolymer transport system component
LSHKLAALKVSVIPARSNPPLHSRKLRSADRNFISPNGSRLVFSGVRGLPRDRNFSAHLYWIDVAKPRKPLQFTFIGDNNGASFTRDGKTLVFASTRNRRECIYKMDLKTWRETQLTTRQGQSPMFSPDGQTIAFVSKRNGNFQIYAINADGSGERRLMNSTKGNFSPAFSSDGKRIAFTSRRDDTDSIYVMDRDGSNQKRLTGNLDQTRYRDWK